MSEGMIGTVRSWGAMILDWTINKLNIFATAANAAAVDARNQLEDDRETLDYVPSGFLDAVQHLPEEVVAFFDGIWQLIRRYIQQQVGMVANAVKGFLCLLRAGQAQPDFIDDFTVIQIEVVIFIWKAIKTVRLSSPDFLGFQIVPQGGIDYVDTILDYLKKTVSQTTAPGAPEAIEAYLMNTITVEQFRCWMVLHDHSPDVYLPVINSRREQLTTVEQIEFVRRATLGRYGKTDAEAGITPAEASQEQQWITDSETALRNVGWIYQTDAAAQESLFDELPTIADHLHWLARNIDDQQYVADYHLLDGFAPGDVVQGMLGAAGAGYQAIPLERDFWKEFGVELRAQGMRKIDAARHYAAHWLHASPQQMREFVFRLRPDRQLTEWDTTVQEFFAAQEWPPDLIAKATTFTQRDFQRILSEQDYGYLDVGWYLSTLYHVPALSYLRDMYRYGIIDEKDLQGYHQDLGYTERDSSRFVGVDSKIKARIRSAESFGWTPSALSRALGLQLITPDFDQQEMAFMGFNEAEIARHQSRAYAAVQEKTLTRALGRVISQTIVQVSTAYKEGVLTFDAAVQGLANLQVPADKATAIIQMADLQYRTTNVKKTVGIIRGAFLKGKLNADGATQTMAAMGLAPEFISSQLAFWKLQLLDLDRQNTVAEIKRWTCEGLISVADAQNRLNNLHVPDADLQLILAEVQICENKIIAREAAAANKQQLALQKAAAQAARQAEAVKQKALAQSMRVQSPATLKKWLKQGVIDAAYFTSKLTDYKYDPATIQLLIESVLGTNGASPPAAPAS